MGCVYIATNKKNGKSYIGMTSITFAVRKKDHISTAAGKRSTYVFHQAIRKYGEDGFDWGILYESVDIEKLCRVEIMMIRLFNTKLPCGYNMADGGGGNPGVPRVVSPELRQRLREMNLGKKQSQETIEKRRKKLIGNKSRTGQKIPEETREKMRQSQKKRWDAATPEMRKQHRGKLTGQKRSDQHKLEHSERMKKWWAGRKAKEVHV